MEQNNLQPKSGKLRLHEGVELPIDGLPIKVQAFINEVVDKMQLEPLRDRLHYLVEKRFRGELNKCEGCRLCK